MQVQHYIQYANQEKKQPVTDQPSKDKKEKDEKGKTKMTMTVNEAGRLGGRSRANKYSAEELSMQARKGAVTIEKRRPGFHAEIAHQRVAKQKARNEVKEFQQEARNEKR